MATYEVKLDHDIGLSKTSCDIEVTARVNKLYDGATPSRVSEGNVVFHRKGKDDISAPIKNGAAKIVIEETRQDEDHSIRVTAEFTDKDGIPADQSIRITIPAKKRQREAGSRPKHRLTLEKPGHPEKLEDNGVKINFTVRLKGPEKDLSGKSVKLMLDDTPHESEPVTDSAGEAFVPVEFQQRAKERSVRVTARLNIGGKLVVSNPQTVVIPAKRDETPLWKHGRYDLGLQKPERLDLGDEYKFILSARLTHIEYCTRGDRKGEERQIPIPGKAVFFEADWRDIPYEHTPVTDKNGWVNMESPTYHGHENTRRINFSVRAEVNGDESDDVRSNSVYGIVPKAAAEKQKTVSSLLFIDADENEDADGKFLVRIRTCDGDKPLSETVTVESTTKVSASTLDGEAVFEETRFGSFNTPETGVENLLFRIPDSDIAHLRFRLKRTSEFRNATLAKNRG